MRTQVGIVGAGPAGLLLAEILHRQGVDSIVVEKHSRAHVLGRVRAGVLEPTTVDVLRENGLAARLDREGHVHDGVRIVRAGGGGFLIDIHRHCGKKFVAYGQTNLQEDLFAAADKRGARIITEAADVRIEGTSIVFEAGRVDGDFIAGCDGFHGVSRSAIPKLREFEKVYPFGWLGILSETPPLREIAYCHSPRGFALASQRSPMLSRYYLQVPLDTRIEDWPDAKFWAEIKARFPRDWADAIATGPSIEKSIAPLRSYVAEPMQHGRLYLAGDAAHIVPPTGAKGLNLAVSDVYYLARALAEHYRTGSMALLDAYSETALRRVWASVRISWYLTMLLHRFPDASAFDQRAQEVELEILEASPQAQAALAEQYAGLPL
ncbi:MAG TPA: 4-hydroxybenzoate 3-monooxygenase [Burkholderiales bacterium]|nr:4-hydroxybenzoate 3-monooxygenase [Burkholderiales bacterium]